MTRLICLGDSFTEGMSDDLRPDGRHRGWSDRVATGLAADRSGVAHYPVTYANLAIRGKLLDQVVAEQFGPALTLGPDIITFHAGANDVLRPGTDLPDLYARYDAAVEQLTATGATVVLFTSLARAGGSGRFADRLERAFHAFNRNVREVADRHGATLVDLEAIHALTDRRFWAPDRLHLNELGHARVAAAVLAELGITDPQVLGGPSAGGPSRCRRHRPGHAARTSSATSSGFASTSCPGSAGASVGCPAATAWPPRNAIPGRSATIRTTAPTPDGPRSHRSYGRTPCPPS